MESASRQGNGHVTASVFDKTYALKHQEQSESVLPAKSKREISHSSIFKASARQKKSQDIIAIAHVLIAIHSYRGIKPLADITDAEEAGVLDCFMAAKTGSTANALGL